MKGVFNMVYKIIPSRYIIRCNLIELLTDKDYIEPSYTYIDGATEKNIKRFANHSTMIELKQDINKFAQQICRTIENTPEAGIKRAYVDENSPYPGLSTYINVEFIKPNNSEYLQKYKKSYNIKLRLSDHYDESGGIEDYDISVIGKRFKDFEQDVIQLVKSHRWLLDTEYKTWQQTHTVSNAQKYRSKVMAIRKSKARNKRKK